MVLNPITGALTNVLLPFDNDIFCSGLSILQNGNVLVTGGNIEGTSCAHSGTSGCGTNQAFEFNPTSNTWSQQADMRNARWYPSSVELPNGNLLEISGTNSTGQWIQTQMETFNYANNMWTALPTTASLPPDNRQVYPRLTLLP